MTRCVLTDGSEATIFARVESPDLPETLIRVMRDGDHRLIWVGAANITREWYEAAARVTA